MCRLLVVMGTIAATLYLAVPEARCAPSDDPAAASLGLTRETGSLPVWASPDGADVVRLSEASRNIRQAVFLVGTAGGGHGTAFAVSRKHRLLATNSHVADLLHRAGKMLAILNETTTIYEVERVWYHPGVLRIFDKRTQAVFRSSNPADGDVFAQSSDVALLQLKEGGPPLPAELTLAAPQALDDVFAQPIAVLGFPGHDTGSWPLLGERPQATFHNGVISRATDFHLDGSASPRERQFLQHTALTFPGFSGSPIFLRDGSVVGLHNSGRKARAQGFEVQLSHGVRVDCLWELIAYHDLTDLLAVPVDAASLDLERFSKPDEKTDDYRRANELAVRARRLIDQLMFTEGANSAQEALEIIPSHAEALYQASRAYTNYYATYQLRISQQVRNEQTALATEYAKKLVQAAPSDVRSTLTTLLAMSNSAVEKFRSGNKSEAVSDQRTVLDGANRILSSGKVSDNWNLAFVYHVRSSAKFNIVKNQGGTDISDSLRDNDESMRLDPTNPNYPLARALRYEAIGRQSEADYWYDRARELRGQPAK